MKRRNLIWPALLLAVSLTVVETAAAAVKVPDDLVGNWYGSYSSAIDRTHSGKALLTIDFQEAEYFEGIYSDGRDRIPIRGMMMENGRVIVTAQPPNPDFGETAPTGPELVVIGMIHFTRDGSFVLQGAYRMKLTDGSSDQGMLSLVQRN